MNILYAIDGSKFSITAIDHALALKCPAGTELKVITVIDSFEPSPSMEGVRENLEEAANKLVADTAQKLKKAHPEAQVSGEVLDGYPVNEILNCSRDWPAHLIVLGSHGHSDLSQLWLGSVARSVLSHAGCAVRIVRSTARRNADAPQNVLIALDDSEHSEHLVEHVLSLPWPYGTVFQCLHVVPQLAVDTLLASGAEMTASLAQQYDQELHGRKRWVVTVADKINSTFGQKVATAHVALGDPRKQILDHAASWPADLIMVGSHGRRGFEKLVMGSVSEAVATQAKCAVEVTRKSANRAKVHFIV